MSAMVDCGSDIADWYRGKAVFITGATGFMGKILVEKLLRSCLGIGPIYVLVREKKNVPSQKRVDDMLTSCLFDHLRTAGVNPKDRLIPIPGNMGLSDLGISDEDRRELQNNVSVVFHAAATVRFNEPLREAMTVNFEGTRSVMKLCREMTHLRAVVYVSTAYTNCNLSLIEECVYPPPMAPDKVVNCVAGMDDDLLKFVTPRLIGKHPNTYTFTKALAEHMVAEYSNELPIVIVRPSIVSAAWREPIIGWVDNFYGANGLIIGASKGLNNSVRGNVKVIADLIPVDVCTNLFIAAAWEVANRETTELVPRMRVYNCVSEPFKSTTWNYFTRTFDRCMNKYPSSRFLTAPGFKMTASQAWSIRLEQALFATLGDIYIWLSGGTPRFQRLRHKLNKAAVSVEFFTTHEWKFNADNVKRLRDRLTPADRAIFNCDVTKIKWEEYMTTYFLGIRRHLLHEEDDTIPECRQRVTRFRLIRKLVQIGGLAVTAIIFFKLNLTSKQL